LASIGLAWLWPARLVEPSRGRRPPAGATLHSRPPDPAPPDPRCAGLPDQKTSGRGREVTLPPPSLLDEGWRPSATFAVARPAGHQDDCRRAARRGLDWPVGPGREQGAPLIRILSASPTNTVIDQDRGAPGRADLLGPLGRGPASRLPWTAPRAPSRRSAGAERAAGGTTGVMIMSRGILPTSERRGAGARGRTSLDRRRPVERPRCGATFAALEGASDENREDRRSPRWFGHVRSAARASRGRRPDLDHGRDPGRRTS